MSSGLMGPASHIPLAVLSYMVRLKIIDERKRAK